MKIKFWTGIARISVLIQCALFTPSSAGAQFEWASLTIDNDVFVGNDSGYSNGFYLSFFDIDDTRSDKVSPSWMVKPMTWTLNVDDHKQSANSLSLGQTMMTPSDITLIDPPADEVPYSAMLALTSSYIGFNGNHADLISTTIGTVGPSAFGEGVQKAVHSLLGSDEPQGWDTQLRDEVVVQFTRGRAWRSWVSQTGSWDLLTHGVLSIGNLASEVHSGATLRFGRNLYDSYATVLLAGSRTANPIAIGLAWNLYAGINLSYNVNRIFTDGNTFKNSRSIESDAEAIGLTLGFSRSWGNSALTFAIADFNVLLGRQSSGALQNLTRFGTLTWSFRI